jgi:hypothetical protein
MYRAHASSSLEAGRQRAAWRPLQAQDGDGGSLVTRRAVDLRRLSCQGRVLRFFHLRRWCRRPGSWRDRSYMVREVCLNVLPAELDVGSSAETVLRLERRSAGEEKLRGLGDEARRAFRIYSYAAFTYVWPRRGWPLPVPQVPPSVRRPRATRTSTTTHAFRSPHFRKVLACGPRLCGTTRGLLQAPLCGVNWRWRGVANRVSPIVRCGRTTLPAKWRRAAYGDTVSPGGSPMSPRMQPRNDKFHELQ